jgi:hypothetical protein
VQYKSRQRRTGRPPRLQAAVAKVLQVHPELEGHPSQIAAFIVKSMPSFDVSGKDVSTATAKLKRLFGDLFDPSMLHADVNHIGMVCLTPDGEQACESCGAVVDQPMLKDGISKGQNAFANELHRVFKVNPIPIPGKGSMISKRAVTVAEFGDGIEGRLKWKALTSFEQLSKSLNREELPQSVTTQLASLIEKECERRGRVISRVTIGETKDLVMSVLLRAEERFPQYIPVLQRLVLQATIYFPDLTGSSKSNKSDKVIPLLSDEEA